MNPAPAPLRSPHRGVARLIAHDFLFCRRAGYFFAEKFFCPAENPPFLYQKNFASSAEIPFFQEQIFFG
jgi:hypothetical protein